jgi:lipopolysaccharide export system permease protein
MKLLTRYVIKEHLPPFFFALSVIMFILLMNFVLRWITVLFGKGLSFQLIMELVFFNLAWMLALAVPMSVLVAALMAFGRLSGDNEITILKTSGISIYKIIRPAILFSLVIMIIMVYFNDKILPNANHRARKMFSNIQHKKPTLKLEPGIFLKLNDGAYTIQVEQISEGISEKSNFMGPDIQTDDTPDQLHHITIFDHTDPAMQAIITAKEGYMIYSSSFKKLIFHLFDGEYHNYDMQNNIEYRRMPFKMNKINIDARNFEYEEREDNYRSDREMDISMMLDEVHKNQRGLTETYDRIIKRIDNHLTPIYTIFNHDTTISDVIVNAASFDVAVRDTNIWLDAIGRAERKISRLNHENRTSKSIMRDKLSGMNKYWVEIHKKFSIPFSSLVFVLIGAPLGIAARKGSMGVGATLSIAFFLIYWVCLILGEDLADRRFLSPFWAMWFPNVVIGLFGAYLTWRAVKETTVIRWDKIQHFFWGRFKHKSL